MNEIVVNENEERIVPVLWTGVETELSYHIVLAGRGARVVFLGLLIGRESQSLRLEVRVAHEAEHTESEVVVKGALWDMAKVDIEGLVRIAPGAKGTKAWLAAHLLLLSKKAKGRAVPSLEILENDVKAGHATTVGRVSEMELFYLMSRGLSEEVAKGMIVEGFLESIVVKLPGEMSEKARKFLIPNI